MKKPERKLRSLSLLVILSLLLFPSLSLAADSLMPSITINTSSNAGIDGKEVYTGLKLSFLLSAIVFVPSLFLTVTCFPKIAMTLALTRQALGIAQTPPNQVLVGMALFLTIAIMSPTFSAIYTNALLPYSEDQLSHEEMYQKFYEPLRDFMLPQTREQDIALFSEITKSPAPETPEQISAKVLVPAFIISELTSAFQIAFLIYLPFLILDLIVSAVLTSMSMITLPPTVISLPIKLMLFVVIDGWGLIIGNIVKIYQH